MLPSHLRDLTDQAVDYARAHHHGEGHTVAAAVLTKSGAVIFGLNAYHFLGGPCGEIAALANHAAQAPDDPIDAVVAVHGPTGEVIAPCGRCRQVLFDKDPEILSVVRSQRGLEAMPVRDLLPHAFDQRSIDQEQRIYMWEGYEQSIRGGSKRQTVRVDDPFRQGPALLVFEKENGAAVSLPADVTGVVHLRRTELTEEHAQKDGFDSLAELQAALDRHYPSLHADAPVDVVSFHVTNRV
ncbi:ASCH domain-containing protein [Nesterenkonia lacusekhoensis]|uniref:Cytidine deaminase/uncharacterized protein YqfB (UPF0267 family) n=1 Tax=Nesterenkonia lacusekhoensis TaxID=150832 RepID=A0ABS4T494_9MICC|nr:ASCH domain-containing protein [Nesterenkonia lacusekhoensis]MBP2319270.1 cytidine deaminase/uncharacterized protein YqfB (UPF0267 family) [Nesterenkonia lacusekhoensis]